MTVVLPHTQNHKTIREQRTQKILVMIVGNCLSEIVYSMFPDRYNYDVDHIQSSKKYRKRQMSLKTKDPCDLVKPNDEPTTQ